MPVIRYFTHLSIVVVVGVLGAALAFASPALAAGTSKISGLSPYPDGGNPNDPLSVTECNDGAQTGVVYRNNETEPYIAVNPTNLDNMIACWHQDRWSNGSAQGVSGAYTKDGGSTWTNFDVPFTRCSGGAPGSTGDFQRASDPWISFGPTGAAYYMALVSDRSTSRNGMAVSKSTDGGTTWSDPVLIVLNNARGPNAVALFHDKNSITADPHDPNLVYATWNIFKRQNFTQVFSRSTDGGKTWSPARPVNTKEKASKHEIAYFRQGAQIVVLPDGTLLNSFYRIMQNPREKNFGSNIEQAIYRSYNRGKHWERLDTPVSNIVPTGALDAELLFNLGIFFPVRDAGQIPDVAVDRNNGNIYIVWQDGRFSPFGGSSAVISRSTDGGDTWSPPIPVHDLNPFNQYFLPTVSVADDGTVGVLFYDFRNDVFGDATMDTDVWLAKLDSDPNILSETRLTENSFDMRQMLITGFRGYFPGDYVGLDAAGNDFVAAFTIANNLGLPLQDPNSQFFPPLQVDSHNRQDIVFARVANMTALTRTELPGLGDNPGGMEWNKTGVPGRAALHNNVPNPFNPTTTIGFELSNASPVTLEVFDVSGRRVRTLTDGRQYSEGTHGILWDGRNDRGRSVASGVYLYRIRAGTFVETKRMVLMK